MSLSIVITTYNRAKVLSELLHSLVNQTDPDFQVVVAIDGSTDGTEAMLASLELPFELKWLNTNCSGYGIAVAPNLGILAAEERAVFILDYGSFPEPGFVAAHKCRILRGIFSDGPRVPADSNIANMTWKTRKLARLSPPTPHQTPRLRHTWASDYLVEKKICLKNAVSRELLRPGSRAVEPAAPWRNPCRAARRVRTSLHKVLGI